MNSQGREKMPRIEEIAQEVLGHQLRRFELSDIREWAYEYLGKEELTEEDVKEIYNLVVNATVYIHRKNKEK